MSHDQPRPHSCGADVAAYALGALEPAEAKAFSGHLQTCTVCSAELAAFCGVIDDLAAHAPPVRAPRSLKRKIMRAVAAEPRTAGPQTGRRSPRRAWIAHRPWLALSTALALVLAVALVAVLTLSGSSPSSRTVTATVAGAGRAALVISHDDRGRLVVHHFPAPPRGKVYEVWLQRGHAAPQPANALFNVNRDGDAAVKVPGSLRGVTAVMVTPEPAGGSRAPTHPPVITARL